MVQGHYRCNCTPSCLHSHINVPSWDAWKLQVLFELSANTRDQVRLHALPTLRGMYDNEIAIASKHNQTLALIQQQNQLSNLVYIGAKTFSQVQSEWIALDEQIRLVDL